MQRDDIGPVVIGQFEVQHVPSRIVGDWRVFDRASNVHVSAFRRRDQAVAWARRIEAVAAGGD